MAAERVVEARQTFLLSIKRLLRRFEGHSLQYLERSRLWRYGLAIIICSLIIAVSLSLTGLLGQSQLIVFTGMVFVCAWYAGSGPGLAALWLGLASYAYFYALSPDGQLELTTSQQVDILGFIGLSLLINVLLAARRSAHRQMQAHYRRASGMLDTVVRHNEYLGALHVTALSLTHKQNSLELLETILERAAKLVNTNHGYVYLLDEEAGELEVKYATGVFIDYIGYRLAKGQGLGGKVWQYGRAMAVEDYNTWSGRATTLPTGLFKAVVGVPLFAGGKVIGVIALAYTNDQVFSRDEINVLTRFSELSSIILENSRLQKEAATELAQRRRNEAELQDQKNLYETLLKAQSDVGEAFLIIENNRVIYANQAVANISGYGLEEVYAAESFLDLVAPAQRPVLADKLLRRMAGEEVEDHYETALMHRLGHEVAIDVAVKELRQEGKIQLVVIARDITHRLRHQNAQNLLVEASRLIAASIDYAETLKNIARLVVPKFSDWCAVDVVEDGQLVRLAVEHSDPAKVELAHELYRRYPPDPEAPQGAWHVIKSQQPEFYPIITEEMVRASVSDPDMLRILQELGLRSAITVPIVINAESIGAISFITAESGRLYDETDLKTAEMLALRASAAIYNAKLYQESKHLAAELQQSKDQLEVILQGVADGIIVLDRAGEIIYANLAVAKVLGYPSPETFVRGSLAKAVSDLQVSLPDGGQLGLDELPGRRAIATKKEASGTFLIRRYDSREERVMSLHAKPVFNPAGEVILSVNILRDITSSRRQEEQKDEFIAIASHELKTPVTSLKTFAQALLRRAAQRGEDEEEMEYLRSIERQSDRLTRLIKNILDVSNLESGELSMELKAVNIGNLVRNIVERLRVTIESHQIQFGSMRNVMVKLDPDRIEQVMNNLIINASQHSPGGSTVKIDIEPAQGEVQILVSDEGEGIAPEQQARVFERFYQASPHRARGAGLGLYISHKIIRQHGGRMWVDSKAGGGATFGLSLPLPTAEPAQPASQATGQPARGSR